MRQSTREKLPVMVKILYTLQYPLLLCESQCVIRLCKRFSSGYTYSINTSILVENVPHPRLGWRIFQISTCAHALSSIYYERSIREDIYVMVY